MCVCRLRSGVSSKNALLIALMPSTGTIFTSCTSCSLSPSFFLSFFLQLLLLDKSCSFSFPQSHYKKCLSAESWAQCPSQLKMLLVVLSEETLSIASLWRSTGGIERHFPSNILLSDFDLSRQIWPEVLSSLMFVGFSLYRISQKDINRSFKMDGPGPRKSWLDFDPELYAEPQIFLMVL